MNPDFDSWFPSSNRFVIFQNWQKWVSWHAWTTRRKQDKGHRTDVKPSSSVAASDFLRQSWQEIGQQDGSPSEGCAAQTWLPNPTGLWNVRLVKETERSPINYGFWLYLIALSWKGKLRLPFVSTCTKITWKNGSKNNKTKWKQ